MRKSIIATLTALSFLAAPAFAGDVTITNGQAVWKSTQCTAPAVPPVLNGVSSDDSADDVNMRITQYNGYTQLVQSYMDCMNKESESDAARAADAVISSAQAEIAEVKQHSDALGMSLKK